MPSSKKPYDPTKPITIGNWPSGLRMPPLRQQQPAKKKLEKKNPANHEGQASDAEKPALWDFDDFDESRG